MNVVFGSWLRRRSLSSLLSRFIILLRVNSPLSTCDQGDDFIPTAVRSYDIFILGLGWSPGSILGMKRVMLCHVSQVPFLIYEQ